MITSGSCHCGNISFALDWRDAALIERAAAASFDGEGTDERLARRRRNWIPDVVFRECR
ncbi:hypothetical protein [Burkholderia ubonensis]|uniref:hypothetical protein n=1 Tax=Burkholderia ubonensis TaxID=101571 RepID=UPI000AF33CA9|nr:hypothetical protein [Burkholderia ubonensis]